MSSTSASTHQDRPWHIADDVVALPQPIVNVVLIGSANAGDRGWILVDAGLPGTEGSITSAAAERFGSDARPAAIVLPHAHYDHVGALKTLASRWDARIYFPRLEMPYVTCETSYPPPDPTAGGGAMTWTSPHLTRGPIDVGDRAQVLMNPTDVPLLSEWTLIETPGHPPGHTSLFRESDGVLVVAGDAFITTNQESAAAALMKPVHIQSLPIYFTHDWQSARRSVSALRAASTHRHQRSWSSTR